ncbi:hypothetical protein EDB92DRAFT_2105729 [Lactarius akahatsu]|uniref:Uncharacterized protein n=1 Tax=Lactarius akahatsu TaxID=416441 RepID=A0AAD4L933_9AGAM|nr:hypothetical protein EDB92DRAFT_2105729 [Lactarius akahatsu]
MLGIVTLFLNFHEAAYHYITVHSDRCEVNELSLSHRIFVGTVPHTLRLADLLALSHHWRDGPHCEACGWTSLRERFSSWTSARRGSAPGHRGTFPCALLPERNGRAGTTAAPALEGIERLNTTLFARVAGLTAFDRLGWVDEDEKADLRDRDGFPMCTT